MPERVYVQFVISQDRLALFRGMWTLSAHDLGCCFASHFIGTVYIAMISADINSDGIVRYFLHPKEAILSQLEKEAGKHKADIEQLTGTRKLIEDDLKESEQQMREFLQSSPALAAKLKAV